MLDVHQWQQASERSSTLHSGILHQGGAQIFGKRIASLASVWGHRAWLPWAIAARWAWRRVIRGQLPLYSARVGMFTEGKQGRDTMWCHRPRCRALGALSRSLCSKAGRFQALSRLHYNLYPGAPPVRHYTGCSFIPGYCIARGQVGCATGSISVRGGRQCWNSSWLLLCLYPSLCLL